MKDKPLEELGEVLKIDRHWDGWYCSYFPDFVDVWKPQEFFAHPMIEVDGDTFTVTVRNGSAKYEVFHKFSDDWWIAQRVLWESA
jgi:hypothetical protein